MANERLRPNPHEIQPERFRELKEAASKMIDVFHTGYDIGDGNPGPIALGYWPLCNYLIYDLLKPEITQEPSMFADAKFESDAYNNLNSLSRKVAAMVPEEIRPNEWKLLENETRESLLSRLDKEKQKLYLYLELVIGIDKLIPACFENDLITNPYD